MGLLAVAAVLYGLRIGGGPAGPPVNAVPVVVLMDTSAPRGVYDPRTRQNSGTNADDISDALGSLPVALHKETLGATWNREDQIVKQNPDLVVIHRSAFTHAMVLEFELGYSAASGPSGVPPPPKARRRLRSFSAITCHPPAWTSWKRSSGTSEERIPEPGSSSTPETGPTRRVSHGNRTWFDDFPR